MATTASTASTATMTREEKEALAHKLHTTWATVIVGSRVLPRDPQAIEDALASDLVFSLNGQEMKGVEAWRQTVDVYQVAIPDACMTHHQALVENDCVAIRWSGEATHTGPFGNLPASGRNVRWEGVDLFHIHDGKIARVWIGTDELTIMQQMGAIPSQNRLRPDITSQP